MIEIATVIATVTTKIETVIAIATLTTKIGIVIAIAIVIVADTYRDSARRRRR